MSKSTSIYTRVNPELKAQVEQILERLGLPMASAINLFLHQIAIHNGIPFDVKLPNNTPLNYSLLSKEQFDEEMEKGLSDLNAGRVVPATQVRENMQRQTDGLQG